MDVEYLRQIVYGSIMDLEVLNSLGKQGWVLCAAVKVTDIQYNYLFYRFKTQVFKNE